MSLNKNWRIIIVDSAEKNLDRLPKNDTELIEKAINSNGIKSFWRRRWF